ncbi:mitochondrial carrier protein [Theileria orientalis]|uniref:Mitochondrial carrier protein n=1 Tax=Theileria orientalis TaxID=68886 RepID=A0A976SJE6_THEOR|nr:mitochondrial carrier protein [Theileria orientalis]
MDSVDPLDWENWTGELPFWQHALCGSIAGVMEHISLFPLDTIKTRLQTQSASENSSPAQNGFSRFKNDAQVVANRNITSKILKHMKTTKATRPGFYSNLFRGSNVIIAGCVPAHVLYFTVYEKIKSAGSIAASGAAATFCHDLVLTPADVIKQRLQLGCYRSSRDCLYNIIRQEGVRSLFRSFHITLLMNVPYHSLLVSIMHLVKQVDGSRRIGGIKDSSLSSIGGAVAGALTTPFDVIKTRLQTQACRMDSKRPKLQIKYKNVITTFENIYRKEGLRGFMRGVTTRIGMCTPSAAISWGTYESLKNLIKLID